MMMSLKSQSNKTQMGLTLIEVLVVLVILVIGILTVVQLFPSGFGVMHGAANASAADRLAQEALESLKQNGTPDGIYASVIDTTLKPTPSNVFDPTIQPTDLTTATTVATLTPNEPPVTTDVDKARYISNETFTVTAENTIPDPKTTVPTPTPIHVLNFGPIFINDPANPQYDVTVNSVPWTAVSGNSAPDMQAISTNGVYPPIDRPQDTLTSGEMKYMIDYANGELAVAPEANYDQYFVFTVEATSASGATVYQTMHLKVPKSGGVGGYDGSTWFAPSAMQDTNYTGESIGTNWVPGTATLYRPLVYKAPGTFDNDPYEFNLRQADSAGNSINPILGSHFDIGVLAFNPTLAYEQGAQSITVQASYTAYDWHVIHEDREIPVTPNATGAGSSAIRLAISDLKEVGDVQSDGTTSTGVVLGASSTEQYDFIFLNLDTGAMDVADTHGNVTDDDTSTGTGPIHVSFRNGRITIPTPLTDVTGAKIQHLRIFYRGAADWAVAVQRAPVRYTDVTTLPGFTNPSGVPAPYFTNPDALVPNATSGKNITTLPATPNLYYYDSTPGSATVNTLYFPVCDVGKIIDLVNVTVTLTPSSGASTSTTLSVVQLSNETAGKTSISDLLTSETPIANAIQSLGGPTAGTYAISFGAVTGVSARAVVLWRDRSVWKQHTLDTILSQ